MSKDSYEADVILNRSNVARARSERLMQSWFPKRATDEATITKSEEELKREDEELFKAEPAQLGLGAIAPTGEADGSIKRTALSSNDKLLEQLLGKKAAKGHRASKALPYKSDPQASMLKPSCTVPANDDSDDEDEGRAGMIKGKRSRKRAVPKSVDGDPAHVKGQSNPSPISEGNLANARADTAGGSESDDEEDVSKTSRKRSTYLDQILAEKAKKKRKKH